MAFVWRPCLCQLYPLVAVQEHELWLQPSSLDAKAGFSSNACSRAGLNGRVPKPDVVLTTYEVVCSGATADQAPPDTFTRRPEHCTVLHF